MNKTGLLGANVKKWMVCTSLIPRLLPIADPCLLLSAMQA